MPGLPVVSCQLSVVSCQLSVVSKSILIIHFHFNIMESEATSLFDVGRWTFDVGRSFLSLPEAPPRLLGTCRHEGHMAVDSHKWKVGHSGMHSHAEHGNEENSSCQLSVVSYQLSVVSYQLSVISYQLSVKAYSSFIFTSILWRAKRHHYFPPPAGLDVRFSRSQRFRLGCWAHAGMRVIWRSTLTNGR